VTTDAPPLRRTLLAAAVIVVATTIAYVPAMRGGFIWDDDRYVTKNDFLDTAAGLRNIWLEIGREGTVQYYPMVFTTFWIEHRLWGDSPHGYHAINVLLHATGAILLWRVLRRVRVPGAWIAAMVFALHPVHVESVAWITERKNVLSGALYLGAALAYLRFRPPEEPAEIDSGRWRYWALALGLFVLALLSKTVTASLPAALLLVIWWRRGRIGAADVVPLVPMLILGLAFGMITAHLEKENVRAEGADWTLTFVQRLLIATRAPWFYLGKLLLPVGLVFIYPRWTIDASDVLAWAFPALTIGLVAALWLLRSRIGRGPLVAALFFGGTLFPALGFVNTYPMRYSFVADHFQYLASIGPIAMIVAAGAIALARAPRAGRAVAAAALLALAALTWQRGAAYRDLETLWRDTITRNESCWMAHSNLGLLLYDRNGPGDASEAEEHLRTALALKEDFFEAHFSLAALLQSQRRYADAMRHYRRAREIKSTKEVEGRIADVGRLVELSADPAHAEIAAAAALAEEGRMDDAITRLEAIVAGRPDFAPARIALGNLLRRADRPADARAQLEAALQLDETLAAAHVALGQLHFAASELEPALARFDRAIALDDRIPAAHEGRAMALARLGRAEDAIEALKRTVELDPANANAQCNVGLLLAAIGRRDEAIAAFRKTLAIDPNHARARRELDSTEGKGRGG
jgi:tetratricopeptide (TPR) repeat protein